ncbi:MAG TPA: choice-of-anchor tandem repeat GloVer-containing protein [Acidobacteriaceae bacterium]|nr:choice-of-anchor tandem repeat GloVer-containing protein [Acidobacteriaceae bacterium]
MQNRWLKLTGVAMALLTTAAAAPNAVADGATFSTLYKFEAPSASTFTSALGSQPDTLPVVGTDGAYYGMTSVGGQNGNGVIYRFDPKTHQYTVLHTFSALNANGENADGATPGMALTRGPGDFIFGMASYGGKNGTGTIFAFNPSGDFTVVYTFSALNANGNNQDGAYPLRAMVYSNGSLYGTTRLGGPNTCLFTHGCGVAWTIDPVEGFKVIHAFSADEGHAASLLQARDGYFYGCAVWPATSLPAGPLPSGIVYRMAASGQHFQVLYSFSQTNASGENMDGADCYEPFVEVRPGVFYASASRGGTNGNGVVFRYSNWNPGTVEVLHDFSALNSAGQNADGALPVGRLALSPNGMLSSNTESGGANGNGVIYSIREDGCFEVLHTFSATNATTGANSDGALPDEGLIVDGNKLIGIAIYGGNGSPAGYNNSGGTLYELTWGQ